jgi:formylglycine-generating enzyme required for sulfatase activity
MAFCQWLSAHTRRCCTLPSEAQWEYACRAGTARPFSYGDPGTDFTRLANLADASLPRIHNVTGGVVVLQSIPADTRFDDGAVVTAEVGSYQPNAWGLFDVHGNAAEWTRSTYQAYPYNADEDREAAPPEGRKVVRGGSFHDRPQRATSSFRLSYPSWQRVHNVGFRVVCQEPETLTRVE